MDAECLMNFTLCQHSVRKDIDVSITSSIELRESKGKPLVEEGTLRIESLVSMKEWVQNCTTRHTRCQRQDYNQRPTWRPTRLIFVGKDNSTPLQLCKGSSLSPDVKYMTLSHRWPEESIFKLLMGNLEALEQSVPVGSLPKNFCDAILLTRFLDVEYLWIDSLCIIQDSKDDWAIEAANMGDVYAHSFCNIAGTASQNAAQGLFVSRDPKALQLIEIKIAQNSRANRGLPNGSYYCLENIWENEVVRAPLLKRGWVFQERYLSPRIVYFGARQLFWECQELEACEMFSAGVPAVFATNYKKNSPFQNAELSGQGASLSEKPLSQDAALLTVWCDIVSIYTGCDLTFEIDKLVALSGIAARIRQMHDSKYLAGIWERGLPWHLLWMVDNSPVTITTKRIDQAPSWSWASINGKVKYVDRKGHGKSCVKILDTDTTLVGNQQFGRVSRGSIRLCGLLSAVEFKADDATLNKIDHTSHTLILYSQTPSKNLELNFGLFPDISLEICLLASLTILEELGSRRFFLLFATSGAGYVMGLILQHTGVSGQYRRLGFFLSDPGVPQVNQTVLVEAHRPKLEPAHYEEYREEDGHSMITII
jgi:Heterokaryon incompatibility protein (HET)